MMSNRIMSVQVGEGRRQEEVKAGERMRMGVN